jgi:hypothetical protein
MATDSVTISPTFNGDSVALTAGMIVRSKPGANNNVVRAQADSLPHVQGVNGVVISGSSAPSGVVVVACIGRQTVQMESGLVPAVGDTVFVSPTAVGQGTNVQPGAVATIGTIADITNYATLGTIAVDVVIGEQGTAGTQGPQGVAGVQGFQGAAGFQGTTGFQGSSGAQGLQGPQGATGVAGAQGSQGTAGTPAPAADWGSGVGALRYFAVDTAGGNDANVGFSDVSQSAAGAVAKKTLQGLLAILPRCGNGRQARVAIRAGSYAAADAIFPFSGYVGYQKLVVTGTDTVASAGATAFQGDTNDAICAGMTTAAGMNVAGYNVTAYTNDAGTITATLQKVGGADPGFGAMPGAPYGCRIRGDVGNSAGLQNACAMVLRTIGTNQVIINLDFGAAPLGSDVFYIEDPGVTGITQTLCHMTGGDSQQGNPAVQLSGLSLGTLETTQSRIRISGCKTASVIGVDTDFFIDATALAIGAIGPFVTVGTGLHRTAIWNHEGGDLHLLSMAGDTNGAIFNNYTKLLWERCAEGGQVSVYNGKPTGGNNIVATFGTNSSTAHGATCQVWGTAGAPQGTLTCGVFLGGAVYGGRVRVLNAGANPAFRLCGGGLGVVVQGFTGNSADGNTDVGFDLTPSGLSANTVGAMGCTVAIVGTPDVTGTVGDIRLSDGAVVSWATARSGIFDANDNKLFAAGAGPDYAQPSAGYTAQIDFTAAGAVYNVSLPKRTGYYFIGQRYNILWEAASGTCTTGPTFSAGNDVNNANTVASTSITAASINTTVSQGVPAAVSNTAAINTGATGILVDAGTQFGFKIITPAAGTGGFTLKGKFVVVGQFVKIG